MASKQEDVRDTTDQFVVDDHAPGPSSAARETDPARIRTRQKQVDMGKNTLGYQRYRERVPRWKRRRGDPETPDVHQVCSKRSFDGQVRKWRRQLHEWDPPDADRDESDEEEEEGEQEQEEEQGGPSSNPAAPTGSGGSRGSGRHAEEEPGPFTIKATETEDAGQQASKARRPDTADTPQGEPHAKRPRAS